MRVLSGGRAQSLSGVGESRHVDHAEDVPPVKLGASRWPARAFRSAVFHHMRFAECAERETIAAVWNEGRERERTAEDADAPLDLADRLSGEDARGGRPWRVRSPAAAAACSRVGE